MAHPIIHSKSNARQFGGKWEDYIHLHEWMDQTSEDKIVYTRYCLESHVKEDCNNYIPSAKEWLDAMKKHEKPLWMIKTMKLEFND